LFGAHLTKSSFNSDVVTSESQVAQVFLGNPRSFNSPSTKDCLTFGSKAEVPFYVHAPYVLNPASANPEVCTKSGKTLQALCTQVATATGRGLVVHAGQGGVKSTIQDAIQRWVETVNQYPLKLDTVLLLENTAGGSSAPGTSLDDLLVLRNELLEKCDLEADKVQICFDTCHAYAADMALQGSLEKLVKQEIVGLVHLNNSKDPANSRRDRHENLEDGTIPLQDLLDVAKMAYSANVPVVLETPGTPKLWAKEIELLHKNIT